MPSRAYIIRSVNTGKLIGAYEDLSHAYALGLVETHNKLYPHDRWVLVEEVL